MEEGSEQCLQAENRTGWQTPVKTLPSEARPWKTPRRGIAPTVTLVSPYTVSRNLDVISAVIDCRFPAEFAAGHIRGARNFPPGDSVGCLNFLLSAYSDGDADGETRRVGAVVLHCEFSQVRAPAMAVWLLQALRGGRMGHLEIYVMQGGYAEFHRSHPELCEGGYLSMHETSDEVHCSSMLEQQS